MNGEFPASPGGSRSRTYANPAVAARVIIAGKHDEAAVVPEASARDVTASALSRTEGDGMEARVP